MPDLKNKMLRGATIAVASLALQGCAVYIGDYRFGIGQDVQVNFHLADPSPPPPYEPFIEPEVVIVEYGVRHDAVFYRQHPEYYHRDRVRYPEHFKQYHSPRPYPAPSHPGTPYPRRHEDPKSKDKHHDENENDHDHH